MAGLRGGGGKGRTKEKRTFFFISLLFENIRYFTLHDISKYQYWQFWQSSNRFFAIFVKKNVTTTDLLK